MGTIYKRSLLSFVVCCILLGSVSEYVWMWSKKQDTWLITWDISGYYMYLPFLFYDDLGKQHNRQYIIDTYRPVADRLESYPSPETGNYINKYSSGMAVMYLPGFAAGHIYAKLAGYPVDGFSFPYQYSMAMYSLLVAFIGLWLIRRVLLYYFNDTTVAIALLVLCFATNYLSYAAVVNMFSHPYLFTLYAALIYLSIMWHAKNSYLVAAAIGLLCGLAALTRPTEIICVFIPALWAVDSVESFKERIALLCKQYKMVLLLGVCAIAVGSIQLVYWKYYSGHFMYWSYGPQEGFDFLRPHTFDCLLSYKKGWLTYTPVMVLSLVGFVPLYKKQKAIFFPILIFTFISLYITFSWKCWWYGGSFSMRAVIQYYALLMFPLSAFIAWALQKRIGAALLFVFIAFCTWLNFVMSYQASVSFIGEYNDMSAAYYWKIFGRLYTDEGNKRLIDARDEIPARALSHLQIIYVGDTATLSRDTTIDGQKVFVIDGSKTFTGGDINIEDKAPGWYRVKTQVYIDSVANGNIYEHPSIYASLHAGEIQKRRMAYYLTRVARQGEWKEIVIDIKKKEGTDAKVLHFGIYNDHANIVYIRRFEIQYVPMSEVPSIF